MSLNALNKQHLNLISLNWMRYTMRSGSGLVFLLITLTFGLSVAHIILMPVEQTMNMPGPESSEERIQSAIDKIGRPVIGWVLGIDSPKEPSLENSSTEAYVAQKIMQQTQRGKDPWVTFLLDDRPALLSIIFLVLLFGMPFVISFLAFNLIAGDIQNRGLRYLLLRTERVNIFLGRFLGTVAISTLVIIIIIATITFYLGAKINLYSTPALITWALQGCLALSILMLPYIALCAWISTLVDSAFFSLVLAKLVIGGVLIAAFLGGLAWDPAKYLTYALPWGIQNHLLHPELTHTLSTIAGCLGYMTLFLLLGYHNLESRDL